MSIASRDGRAKTPRLFLPPGPGDELPAPCGGLTRRRRAEVQGPQSGRKTPKYGAFSTPRPSARHAARWRVSLPYLRSGRPLGKLAARPPPDFASAGNRDRRALIAINFLVKAAMTDAARDYSETLFLPRTEFPM